MALIHQEFHYPSANGRDIIAAVMWSDNDAPPRCILQIVHGMCEHMGRYTHFAGFLASHGMVVCGNDHAGHGKSKGEDGYGYLAHQNGDDVLVEDVRQMNRFITGRYPGLPVVMLGHSMGSFICRRYITKYGEELSGIIISGTAGDNPATGMGLALAKTIGAFKGKKHHSKLLHDMAFGKYNDRYEERHSIYDWLSRDTAVADRYAADEACTFTFTASAYADLFRLLRSIEGASWAQRVPKDKPYYLMSGTMDPVGSYAKGPTQVYGRLKDAGIGDLTLKLYEGGRHEMLNEINKEEVYGDLLSWINRVLSGESTGTQTA